MPAVHSRPKLAAYLKVKTATHPTIRTQERLAELLAIKQSDVSRLMAGKRWTFEWLDRIAPTYGMTPGEFLLAAEQHRLPATKSPTRRAKSAEKAA